MVTAMSDDNKFRVWVGCLACYNEGRLVGEWFDAEDCPQDEDEFNEAVPGHKKIRQLNPHEELWVFDHENSPVSGEYSPMAARQYAEWLEDLDDDQREAFDAYLSGFGIDFDEDAVGKFQDAYIGRYEGAIYRGGTVGKGYAEERIEDDLAQAKQIIAELGRFGDPRSVEWLTSKVESWCSQVDAESEAWDMEANGEISAFEAPGSSDAFVFRPY